MANAQKGLDEIRNTLNKSLNDIYSKYEELSQDEHFRTNVTATGNVNADPIQILKKISLSDVTSDPLAQKLLCRMKCIIQTPGYMKLFKRITYELRSDMDQIIIMIVRNHMSEDNPTKNDEHVKLHGYIYEEKERLRKYCGSIVVDEYYEFLAMQYHLLIKLGIDNTLMNQLLIAKEIDEQSQIEKENLQ